MPLKAAIAATLVGAIRLNLETALRSEALYTAYPNHQEMIGVLITRKATGTFDAMGLLATSDCAEARFATLWRCWP